MSWSRCSKLCLAFVVCLAAVAAPGAATDVAGSGPESAAVGTTVSASYTLSNLYSNTSDDWTLSAHTDLQNPTWRVALYDNKGDKIGDNRTLTEQNVTQAINGSTTMVRVTVSGDVASVSNFTYDPAQRDTLAAFTRVVGNTETPIDTETVRPYTPKSQSARTAIEAAEAAIESASTSGASVGGARDTLSNAVSAYDAENFANAEDLAAEAERKANDAEQSSEQQSLLLMAGGGLVALVALAGGVVWFRNRGDDYDELG